MSEYQVRLFVRTTGHSTAYAETSWHVELQAESLAAAEAKFFAEHLVEGRYRIMHRRTIVILEPTHVVRIEIEEMRDA